MKVGDYQKWNRLSKMIITSPPDSDFWGGLTVYLEAGGESFAGKIAVAFAIVNRMKIKNKGVCEIVFASQQFSCHNSGDPGRMRLDRIEKEVWRDSIIAFRDAAAHVIEDITKGATHYLNEELTKKIRKDGSLPPWFDEKLVTLREGKHTFLKGVKF